MTRSKFALPDDSSVLTDQDSDRREILTQADLNLHFHRSVQAAIVHQGINASDSATSYLGNLLLRSADTSAVLGHDDALSHRPLALLYGDAMAASNERERANALQRLGDIALIMSGLFSGHLRRRSVGVDYYVGMGEGAYDSLSCTNRALGHGLRELFAELARGFVGFMDVLREVGQGMRGAGQDDILAAYEDWLCAGSQRSLKRLHAAGLVPVQSRPSGLN